jgi:hemolysin III
MKTQAPISTYSPFEESINIYSHAVGIVLSLIALILLMVRSAQQAEALPLISVTIFGLSLVTLYTTSTFYHNCKQPALRARLRIFDHVSIYILIAGTYTPFALLVLTGNTGWIIFGISWGLALVGSCLKIFFTGKYTLLSTIMYGLMGWLIVFAIKPLTSNLAEGGLLWLVIGGILYSTGGMLYSIKRLPLNHAIFHLFVLSGSFCHFISLYYFVLPAR